MRFIFEVKRQEAFPRVEFLLMICSIGCEGFYDSSVGWERFLPFFKLNR